MNILDEILKEHGEIRDLLKKAEGADGKSFALNALHLTVHGHHHAEEEVVFPEVEQADKGASELVEDLEAEHHDIEAALLDLISKHGQGQYDHETLGTIKEELEHHMQEEENQLFAKVRELMTEDQMEALTEPFEKAEEEGKEEAEKETR